LFFRFIMLNNTWDWSFRCRNNKFIFDYSY